MASPFPGMNPYLEHPDAWHDFHEAFLPHLRELITAQLPEHHIVKIDEHIYIHEPTGDQRTFAGRAVDVEALSFLEIRDKRDRQLSCVALLATASIAMAFRS